MLYLFFVYGRQYGRGKPTLPKLVIVCVMLSLIFFCVGASSRLSTRPPLPLALLVPVLRVVTNPSRCCIIHRPNARLHPVSQRLRSSLTSFGNIGPFPDFFSQGEVSNLQSERDGLLQKLSSTEAAAGASASRAGASAGGGKAGGGGGGGAALAKMKNRVAELEARIKENRLAPSARLRQ